MKPLEKLFVLEIAYHARLRGQGRGAMEPPGIRASYALQCGYEALLRSTGHVVALDVERLCERFLERADPRDVFAARDSLVAILRIEPRERRV
jgi:hypothetical protein